MKALAFLVLCGAVLAGVAFGQTTLEQTGKVKLEFVKMYISNNVLSGTDTSTATVTKRKFSYSLRGPNQKVVLVQTVSQKFELCSEHSYLQKYDHK